MANGTAKKTAYNGSGRAAQNTTDDSPNASPCDSVLHPHFPLCLSR